jgi:uncharacterized protein YjbJ (UPF0337 family)
MQTREMSPPSGGPGETNRPGPSDDAAGAAKEAVAREIGDARQRLSGAAHELKAEAGNAGANLSSAMSDAAERGKDEAAEGLRAFSTAIRRASDDLGARDASIPARLAQEAAHGLERLSDGLQARTVADMSRSIGDFGRQNPAAFLTGCLLAGVAIGRVLVASGDRASRYDDDRGFGDDRGAGAYRPGDAYGYRGSAQPGGAYDYRASRASSEFGAGGGATPAAGQAAPANPTASDPSLDRDPPKPAGVGDDTDAGRPGGAMTGGRHGEL